jgi:serine protease inhibitor
MSATTFIGFFSFPMDSGALLAGIRDFESDFRKISKHKRYGVTLKTANQLFVQQGLKMRKPFLDSLNRTFATTPRRLDFAKAPEASRKEINRWIAKQTEGLHPSFAWTRLRDEGNRDGPR